MKRKLIFGERIMYVDANTPVNCVFAVKIRGSFTLERLRLALRKVQAKHPLLNAAVEEDKTGTPYFIFHEQAPEIPVRIASRQTDDDWEKVSASEWELPFDIRQAPLARIVWLRSEEVSDLILICPHCICDGAACVTLMREILLLLDQPDSQLEAYTSFNNIEEFIPSTVSANKMTRFKANIFSLLARFFLSLKSARNNNPVGKPYLLHWKLDETGTTALTARCKAENTSIHAAFCVALLEAFRLVNGDKAKNKVICPADIRRFIPAIKSDTMFAFAPIVELSADKDVNKGFWAKAGAFKQEMTDKIAGMKVPEMLFITEYLHATVKKMIAVMKSSDGSHDFTFSNMGRLNIPEHYSSFELEAVYSPTVAFPWKNPNTIVLSTFRGRMNINIISNDAFLSEAAASAIKEKAMEQLMAQEAVLQA